MASTDTELCVLFPFISLWHTLLLHEAFHRHRVTMCMASSSRPFTQCSRVQSWWKMGKRSVSLLPRLYMWSKFVASHSEAIEMHVGICLLAVLMEILSVGPAGSRHFEWVMWWVGSRDFFYIKKPWPIVDYLGNQIKVLYMMGSHCWHSGC